MSESETVCIDCGASVETAFENRLPDGQPCPACRRRAMDALPPLLPSSDRETVERAAHEHDHEPSAEPWAQESPRFTYLPGFTDGDDDGPMRA